MPPQVQGKQELQPIYGAQRSRTDKKSTKSFPTRFTIENLCQNQPLGSRGDVCGLGVPCGTHGASDLVYLPGR